MNPTETRRSTRRALIAAAAVSCAAAVCSSALAQAARPAAAPTVDGAWARPTVQGQAVGGAYLRITGGTTSDRLLGASARTVAKTVELHTMQMDGSVMRMRQVDAIAVPAGAVVKLEPGGFHLMLVGLAQPLKPGDSFPLTLQFEKAGALEVAMKVNAAAQEAPAHDHAAHKH